MSALNSVYELSCKSVVIYMTQHSLIVTSLPDVSPLLCLKGYSRTDQTLRNLKLNLNLNPAGGPWREISQQKNLLSSEMENKICEWAVNKSVLIMNMIEIESPSAKTTIQRRIYNYHFKNYFCSTGRVPYWYWSITLRYLHYTLRISIWYYLILSPHHIYSTHI